MTGELVSKKYGDNVRFRVQHTELIAEKLIGSETKLKFHPEIVVVEKIPTIKNIIYVYRDNKEIAKRINTLSLINIS